MVLPGGVQGRRAQVERGMVPPLSRLQVGTLMSPDYYQRRYTDIALRYPLTIPGETTATTTRVSSGTMWVEPSRGDYLFHSQPSQAKPAPVFAATRRMRIAKVRRDLEPDMRKAHWLK